MGATDLDTLMALQAHAEQARDEAARQLADGETTLRKQRLQADHLSDYRTETRQRWASPLGGTASVAIMHCYSGFMDRLEQAMAEQRRICTLAEQRVARARTALGEAELRLASVRKLIERRQQACQAEARRLDQKRMDDAAQRAAWSRPGPFDLSHR